MRAAKSFSFLSSRPLTLALVLIARFIIASRARDWYNLSSTGALRIYDKKISLNGKPWPIKAGLFKYYQILPEEWKSSLRSLKDCCGINTVEIEIPWSLYHSKPGEGVGDDIKIVGEEKDLVALLRVCHVLGLRVIASLGPTVCGHDLELSGLPMEFLRESWGKAYDWWPRDFSITRRLNDHWARLIKLLYDAKLLGSQPEDGPLVGFLVDPGCIGLFDNPHVYFGHLKNVLDVYGIKEAILFPITPAILKLMARNLMSPLGMATLNNDKVAVILKDTSVILYSDFRGGNEAVWREVSLILKHRQPLFLRNIPSEPRAIVNFKTGEPMVWGDIPKNARATASNYEGGEAKKLAVLLEFLVANGASLSFTSLRQGFPKLSLPGIKYVTDGDNFRQLTSNQPHGSLLSEMGTFSPLCKTLLDLTEGSVGNEKLAKMEARWEYRKCEKEPEKPLPLRPEVLNLIVIEKVVPLRALLKTMKREGDYNQRHSLKFVTNQGESKTPYVPSAYIVYAKEFYGPNLRYLNFSGVVRDSMVVVLNQRIVTKVESYTNRVEGPLNFTVNLGVGHGPDNQISDPKNRGRFKLLLMVENLGLTVDVRRPRDLRRQRAHFSKGIDAVVKTDAGDVLVDWEVYQLQFDPLLFSNVAKRTKKVPKKGVEPALTYTLATAQGPAFFWATFNYEAESYTHKPLYLHMIDWYGGYVMLNGHVLGKYDHVGPQQTLFCPVPYLKEGLNKLAIFEEKLAPEIVDVTYEPIMDESYELSSLLARLKE